MRRLFLPLAVLILLVAACLRLWQLHAYPPGPHYDEAVYLLVTRSIAFGGARPFPIVEAYQGREVLYMYLDAPLLHLIGNNIFTLHVSNAFYNLITVAASMALGRAMFRERRGLIVGLAIGMMMALSFPQIWLGRQAFRAVTLPLMQALALWALWRGLNARRRGWLWLLAGGILAGGALYTYMASRLFPIWLLLGGLALIAFDRARRGWRLCQGVIFFVTLALVVLPMGLYALAKPDIFLGRLNEVTLPGDSISLMESLVLHARMFFVEGDPYLRYNIPGRPYFTWLEGLFMLVGIGVCLWRVIRPGRPTERTAYFLALLSPLMVIPSVVSVGGLPPSHMRSLGMIPLIFVLVAVGLEFFLSRLLDVFTPCPIIQRRAITALVVLALALGGVLAGAAYFGWATRADVYYETDADLAAAARWLPGHVDNATLVYVAARDRGHPTVTIETTLPVTWLGTDSLFRAPAGRNGLYIFPRSAPPPADWLAWLEPGRVTDVPLGPDGRTAFEAFRLPGDTPLPVAVTNAPVENAYVTFAGLSASSIPAGDSGDLVMAWTVRAAPPAPDLTPIVQIEDAHDFPLYRSDVYITETDRWRTGETYLQRVRASLPAGTPPGTYAVRVAWVEKGSDTYVPYAGGAVWATVGAVTVPRPASFPAPDEIPLATRQTVDIAPGLLLLGWDPLPTQARPGETLSITLAWMATIDAPIIGELSVILQSNGDDIDLWRGQPTDGFYPPEQWAAGEVVVERARWLIPRDTEPGNYRVILQRGGVNAEFGPVSIAGVPRLMDAPDVAQVLAAGLGDALELYGYTLETGQGSLTLDLVWRARQPVSENYTVFVHLLDDNNRIVAQRDVMPQDNGYPTSLWAEGEYVIDRHTLDELPSGSYTLVVGMYSQATGQRLLLNPPGADAIMLGQVEVSTVINET